MKRIYFDQNVTTRLYQNCSFSDNFFKQQFQSPPKLIITPRTLIELSGLKIKACLKGKNEYSLDFSDELLNREIKFENQVFKALDYYEHNIRDDLFTVLNNKLSKQKRYVKKENEKHGHLIFDSYLKYLNSDKGKEEIRFSIQCDRVSALSLERFKDKDTYFRIYDLAVHFLAINPHIPCLRLFVKSYKRLPPANNQREKEEFRKPVKKLIKISYLKKDGDLVDAEIIQFAILGYDDLPVHFYTQDSADKIRSRLILFYLLFKQARSHSQKLLRDEMNKPALREGESLEKIRKVSNLQCRFGKVSIIDDSGHIIEDIDVKKYITSQVP